MHKALKTIAQSRFVDYLLPMTFLALFLFTANYVAYMDKRVAIQYARQIDDERQVARGDER